MPDQASDAEAQLISAGVRFLEGMIGSGHVALEALEQDVANRTSGPEPEMQAIVGSLAKGYGAFFTEMTRTTRLLSEHYRSDSGKLAAKPVPVASSTSSFSVPDEERKPTDGSR